MLNRRTSAKIAGPTYNESFKRMHKEVKKQTMTGAIQQKIQGANHGDITGAKRQIIRGATKRDMFDLCANFSDVCMSLWGVAVACLRVFQGV